MYLRSLEEKDAGEKYLHWLSDPDVNKFLSTKNICLDSIKSNIKKTNLSQTNHLLGIFLDKTNTHIGNVTYGYDDNIKSEVMHKDSCHMGIMIGDKKVWGMGYGTEAIALMSDYLLKHHVVKKIYAGVHSSNHGSLKIFKNNGFVIAEQFSSKLVIDGIQQTAFLLFKEA